MSADATVAALDALIVRMQAAGAAAARTSALAMQAAGMRRTPVQKGTLRRSWRTELLPSRPGVYSARTGPTVVYARRIELGFKGTDSLGRTYNQAPKPYVKPAYEETAPKMRAIAVAAYSRAIRG